MIINKANWVHLIDLGLFGYLSCVLKFMTMKPDFFAVAFEGILFMLFDYLCAVVEILYSIIKNDLKTY
jgi:hypothetical protein